MTDAEVAFAHSHHDRVVPCLATVVATKHHAVGQIVDPARLQHGDLDVIVAMRTGHPVRQGITHVKPQSDEIDMLGKLSRYDVRNQNKVAQRASFTSKPILVG